jgi:UDP-2,3-diacylglucosamine hydrolase
MPIHFISDLHLCDEQPHLLRLFEYYLDNYVHHAQQLYILGDLFEVWIGDDYQPDWVVQVQQRLHELTQKGTEIFFCHGNRDFLVGETFAQKTGVQLLNEYQIIQLGHQSALICHGDSLCIDDIPYQEFRSQVRQTAWQQQFLALPIEQRLAIVNDYRDQSKAATAAKTSEIMDVNQDQVKRIFHNFNVDILIHGHTHRPAIHSVGEQQRIVLSDWRDYGQFLQWRDGRFLPTYFDLSGERSS